MEGRRRLDGRSVFQTYLGDEPWFRDAKAERLYAREFEELRRLEAIVRDRLILDLKSNGDYFSYGQMTVGSPN